MKCYSHDKVYHLLVNNNKGEGRGGEDGLKERVSLERGF